jgi:carbon storage regulator
VVLVLSRKKNEKIVIGDDVIVTILEIRGDQIQLGISAPREVSIHRMEVYESIKRVTEEAAQSSTDSIEELRRMRKRNEGAEEEE